MIQDHRRAKIATIVRSIRKCWKEYRDVNYEMLINTIMAEQSVSRRIAIEYIGAALTIVYGEIVPYTNGKRIKLKDDVYDYPDEENGKL